MPRGGRRIGAGRKTDPNSVRSQRKAQQEGRQTATVLQHPSAPPSLPPPELPVADEFAVPDDLSVEERNVWLQLSTEAFKARTLHRGNAERFKILCKNIIRERALAITDLGGGKHRGMIQLVEKGLDVFMLGAYGRPIVQAAPTHVDSDDAFFGGASGGR